MAASIGVRLICVFRFTYQRLLKSKLVTTTKTRYIHLPSKCLSSMQIISDFDSCFNTLPHCDQVGQIISQIRRNFLSFRNVTMVTSVGTRLHNNDSVHERTCWKCNRTTDPVLELFFCKCGVVQTPADIDFFKLLGIEESFDIDVTYLSHMLIELQKRLHPDKYTNKSDTEQELAVKQSALINKAYTTLLKPLPRAIYLLDLHDLSIREEEMEQIDFLNEIMEMNETLAEAHGRDEVESLELKVFAKLDSTCRKMAEAFRRKDYAGAKPYVVKYQYYSNVVEKIKNYYREMMT